MTPFLVGERVYLRALVVQDADGDYPAWLNDQEVCHANSHAIYPYTRDQARAYIAAVNADQQQLVLAICDKATDQHIGNIALQNINMVYRSADFAILIGNKAYWDKGYGTEAGRLLIDHAFYNLNLERIACATFENNEGMIKLAHKLGFRTEGERRNAAHKDGWLDVVEFGLLREEW